MLRDNEDLKEKTQTKKQVTCLKRRKTRVTKFLLVLVLIVIGWEGGAIFLEQSQNEVKIPDYSVTLPQLYQKSKEKKSKVNCDFSKAVIEEPNKRLPIWSITVISLRQSLHLVW